MVLKISIIGFVLTCFLQETKTPLFDQYQPKIEKMVNQVYNLKNNSQIKIESQDQVDMEVFDMSMNGQLLGILFLKEVKACAINGCSSDQKIENLNSEYYDIAVITDTAFNIQKIKVLDYFSDYGYEISSKKYLKKYEQFNLCQFNTETPLVDGISGATISYNALNLSLSQMCSKVK